MASSRQDIYARNLISDRGYPLWMPEPDMSLPDIYIREGLRIGDVGVVVPENGSFDVFFNICLPATHKLHRDTGVPNNFTPILLGDRDIAKFPEAEDAGSVISTSSVVWTSIANPPSEDSSSASPGPLNYNFVLSSREGAILILPEGAESCLLRNERIFRDEAIRHAVDWYTFAEQRLGRIINHDSLYLLTGLYKTRSWSLAAYQHDQNSGLHEASAQFKARQIGGIIAANYVWETRGAMHRRVGPSDQYYRFGIPNQTVFIRGFKIAIREGILARTRVSVKAGLPSVRPYRDKLSGSPWSSYQRGGISGSRGGSTANVPGVATSLSTDTAGSEISSGESDVSQEGTAAYHFPEVKKLFHPSDSINQYLLQTVPSATVAVTHDSQWTRLLETGSFKPEELSEVERLVAGVIFDSSIVSTHEGAVYLQSRVVPSTAIDDDTIALSLQGRSSFSLRSEPSEHSEVREDLASAPSRSTGPPVLPSFVPVRRPRRGRMQLDYSDAIHQKYHHAGRQLKFSGDTRFWSTHPSTHKEYRPLSHPPLPSSPYHKYGAIIARLELVDALVCFAYSLWIKDYSRKACYHDTWVTIEAFLGWCKNKWTGEDTFGEREKALLGLIWMIEGFIRARKFYYTAKLVVDPEIDRTWAKMRSEMAILSREAERAEMNGGSQATPQMLPSPASITSSNRRNSISITNSAEGKLNTDNSSAALVASRSSSLPRSSQTETGQAALPPHLIAHVPNASDGRAPTTNMVTAASKATVPLGPLLAYTIKEQSNGILSAGYCMEHAQRFLTLPILARHYPTTFARMVGTSLSAHEEHEPDIEDEEGELFWPGQCVTGEGLGWVCLMGKAMVKEIGRDFGYVGLAGVVPKPEPPSGGSPADSSRQSVNR